MALPSAQLLATRIVNQERAALAKALTSASEALENPVAGTVLAQDLEAIDASGHSESLRNVLWWTHHRSVAQMVMTADEMLLGITRLLTDDEILPVPAFSLARSIHEVSAIICSLADPRIDWQERLARCAAQMIRDTQTGAAALSSFPTSSIADAEREQLTSARKLAHDLLERSGFLLTHKGVIA